MAFEKDTPEATSEYRRPPISEATATADPKYLQEPNTVQTRQEVADMMDESLADIRASAAELKWKLEQAHRETSSRPQVHTSTQIYSPTRRHGSTQTPSSLSNATRLSEHQKQEQSKIQASFRDMVGIQSGWDTMSQSVGAYREATAEMNKESDSNGKKG